MGQVVGRRSTGSGRRALMVVLTLAACAESEAPSTQEELAPALLEVAPLKADPACADADADAARAHLLAATRIRGAVALERAEEGYTRALDTLERAQRACLLALPEPASRLHALRGALLRDAGEPRSDRGGVPGLPWRLLEDAALRATAALVDADDALSSGAYARAGEAILVAQRARLEAVPQVYRFLDEGRRTAFLRDPAFIGWLGTPE